jgi:hypothetical protein
VFALPLAVLLAAPAPAVPWTQAFLRTTLGFSSGDTARIVRGDAMVRMIDDRGGREIATVGAMRLSGAPVWSADFALIERLRRSNPDFRGIGRMGAPPAASDFADADLDPEALPQLRKCRPHQCPLNVPAETIEALQAEAASPELAAKSDAIFQGLLRDVAARYQEEGDASLPVFTNRKRRVATADAWELLLQRKPTLAHLSPVLDAQFRACPREGRPCPASVIWYWYRERSWKHEVVGLNQAAFDESPVETGRRVLLAEKTFYANHYFRSALTVTGILEDPSGSYIFFVSRNETDNGSNFNFIERALAGLLVPRRLTKQLVWMRDAVVRPVVAARPRP